MEFVDDQSSTSASSSSSSHDVTRTNPSAPSHSDGLVADSSPETNLQFSSSVTMTVSSHKKRSGRKKFKETRHPVYRGVRQKNGGRWVCEVREPNSKKLRIWLGTFPVPEMAARAYDVAALALRGENAVLNFPDSAWLLSRAKSSSAVDIRKAAFQAAMAFKPCDANPSSSSARNEKRVARLFGFLKTVENSTNGVAAPTTHAEISEPLEMDDSSAVKKKGKFQEYSSSSTDGLENGSDISVSTFLDEELIFNMPELLDSMAEGMLLTPPGMKRGFSWDDVGHDIDLTDLWAWDDVD